MITLKKCIPSFIHGQNSDDEKYSDADDFAHMVGIRSVGLIGRAYAKAENTGFSAFNEI